MLNYCASSEGYSKLLFIVLVQYQYFNNFSITRIFRAVTQK